MDIKIEIEKLKETLQSVGKNIPFPDNGQTAVVILENQVGKEYNVSVAVGEVSAISQRYFEIKGKVFDDTYNLFMDSMLRIEPDTTKARRGEEYVSYVVNDDLQRAMAMADWDGKFKTIEDLVVVLDSL